MLFVVSEPLDAIAVPSVVVPAELRFEQEYLNYLINPQHPDIAASVEVGELRTLDWDPRFKRE
jgi:RES domain-containing protein